VANLTTFTFTETCFRQLPEGTDPEAFVISANIHRRHLTAEQKRELIAKLIKADPARSDRQIAETAKVDNKTVGKVREKLEATEEIPQLTETTGKDGKRRKTKTKTVGFRTKKGSKERAWGLTEYHALQEKLIDALLEWPSSSDHALECSNKTRERLDQAIDDWCRRENEGEDDEKEAA
jgi:hypothetical protein